MTLFEAAPLDPGPDYSLYSEEMYADLPPSWVLAAPHFGGPALGNEGEALLAARVPMMGIAAYKPMVQRLDAWHATNPEDPDYVQTIALVKDFYDPRSGCPGWNAVELFSQFSSALPNFIRFLSALKSRHAAITSPVLKAFVLTQLSSEGARANFEGLKWLLWGSPVQPGGIDPFFPSSAAKAQFLAQLKLAHADSRKKALFDALTEVLGQEGWQEEVEAGWKEWGAVCIEQQSVFEGIPVLGNEALRASQLGVLGRQSNSLLAMPLDRLEPFLSDDVGRLDALLMRLELDVEVLEVAEAIGGAVEGESSVFEDALYCPESDAAFQTSAQTLLAQNISDLLGFAEQNGLEDLSSIFSDLEEDLTFLDLAAQLLVYEEKVGAELASARADGRLIAVRSFDELWDPETLLLLKVHLMHELGHLSIFRLQPDAMQWPSLDEQHVILTGMEYLALSCAMADSSLSSSMKRRMLISYLKRERNFKNRTRLSVAYHSGHLNEFTLKKALEPYEKPERLGAVLLQITSAPSYYAGYTLAGVRFQTLVDQHGSWKEALKHLFENGLSIPTPSGNWPNETSTVDSSFLV